MMKIIFGLSLIMNCIVTSAFASDLKLNCYQDNGGRMGIIDIKGNTATLSYWGGGYKHTNLPVTESEDSIVIEFKDQSPIILTKDSLPSHYKFSFMQYNKRSKDYCVISSNESETKICGQKPKNSRPAAVSKVTENNQKYFQQNMQVKFKRAFVIKSLDQVNKVAETIETFNTVQIPMNCGKSFESINNPMVANDAELATGVMNYSKTERIMLKTNTNSTPFVCMTIDQKGCVSEYKTGKSLEVAAGL